MAHFPAYLAGVDRKGQKVVPANLADLFSGTSVDSLPITHITEDDLIPLGLDCMRRPPCCAEEVEFGFNIRTNVTY